jgi:ribosomal protein S18 acetylase RimI-like enzyme
MRLFRAITDADIEETVSLWRSCGLTRAWNDPYQDIAFAREGPNSTVLVRYDDSKLVASVMAGHDGHRGMLYYVAVAADRRRRGLGTAAVHAAEAWLAERGVWKVNLLVRTENQAATGFYAALGYEINPVLCMSRRIIAS